MSGSSPCHLRLEQPRVAIVAALILMPVLVAAAVVSGLPWLLRSLMALITCSVLALELRDWACWRELVLGLPDRVWLLRSDGAKLEAAWGGARRVGPLLVVALSVGGRNRRLALWLPAIETESRRLLLRQLPRMVAPSV